MSETERPLIIRATGEKVHFDPERLRRSLERSKADPAAIDQVVSAVTALMHEGMTTKEIYRKAFSLLRKTKGSAAARYKLKRAIMELGPAGFAFEKYVAALLEHDGYRVQTGVFVEGACVKHEIDVLAERKDELCMIECKFHGATDKYSDVKIPLYIQSRFKDVEAAWMLDPELHGKTFQGWVVTNTRFTSDAVQYGSCVGLKLIGWDHPPLESLKERIDRSGLHPVTSLTTLTNAEKRMLLEQGVVMCADLGQQHQLLTEMGIGRSRLQRILSEARDLCGH